MNEWIDKVIGPVIPVPTPFDEKQEIRPDSMESYSKFLVENGIRNIMTTVGTSRYNLLTFDEVKSINTAMVKGMGGKGVSIVANPTVGGVKHAIDFAKHSEDIGADLLLLYFPERHYGDDNTFKFFETVAKNTNINILVHEMPMRNGFGGPNQQYSVDLIKRLLEIENIVGLKEEALDADYSNKVVSAVKDDAVIIGAGGGMSRYLSRDFDLGAKAFLGGIGGFEPHLELEFYEALQSGNKSRAEAIVNEIEKPYFADVCPLGWHPSLKSALALKGLMPKFERQPMKIFTEEENNFMKEVLRKNSWL